MSFLSPQEKNTLNLICDALVPSLEPHNGDAETLYRTSASDNQVADLVEETLEAVASQSEQRQIKLVLRALENGLFNGITTRQWHAFAKLSQPEREKLLYNWASSRLFLRRKTFQTFKKLTLFIHYSNMPNNRRNQIWGDIGYPDPPEVNPSATKTIQPLPIQQDTTLHADVLIIGSGAGGGVVAGELAQAGLDVIVAEKGGYYNEADFSGSELHGNNELYEKKGAFTTSDAAILILAGSALGGGTIVNWSASFATPDHVLEEWRHDFQFTEATSSAFQESLQAVQQRANVNINESSPNGNNRVLEKGCRELGYHLEVIPRNVKGCEDCGFCNYGCSFGAKQSTLKTWLQDAYDHGARFLVQAQVEAVQHSKGEVQGALLKVRGTDGKRHTVNVQAKTVVVSAGSIHTPALLRRSGLKNPNIGANLRLHPVTAIVSEFDEPTPMWQGAPMTRISKEFANLDGKGYGYALETAPAHPGITAASLRWTSAREHRHLMQNSQYLANIIVITRDYYGGRVRVDKQGNPILDYQLHPYDAQHLQHGVLSALRIHHAAGAKMIHAPHNAPLSYKTGNGRSFEDFLLQVERKGIQPHALPLFSAHQMSSCRLAGTPELGAVDPNGETFEVKNLFVADASVLPTATGVNPMISIMGLAHYIAQQIKVKLAV